MNARRELDVVVTDWLHSEANSRGSEPILKAALARANATGQDRFVTQFLFGDQLGRSGRLRWALLAAVLAMALLGAALVVGALRRDPPLPAVLGTNGWVAFHANGEAGDGLEVTHVGRGNGNGDIYVVREGVQARRIIGGEDDGLHEMCPVFSPDGTRLAYIGLDMRGVGASPPPQRSEESLAEGPPTASGSPTDGSLRWRIIVVEVAADGAPTNVISGADAQPSLASCAEWSPTDSDSHTSPRHRPVCMSCG
jgi:hypothetical protein